MTAISKLKLGDRVRVTKVDRRNHYFDVGDEGTVICFDKAGDVWVDFSNGENPVMHVTMWCIQDGFDDEVTVLPSH